MPLSVRRMAELALRRPRLAGSRDLTDNRYLREKSGVGKTVTFPLGTKDWSHFKPPFGGFCFLTHFAPPKSLSAGVRVD